MSDDETGCRKVLHWFVRFMKGLTIFSLLATVAAYVIIIDYGVKSDELSSVDKAFSVLGNTGFIVLAAVLIVAEFEPVWFIKHVVIMHYWAARGFWILWMGIQTISTSKQLAAAIGDDPDVDKGLLETFGIIVGSVLIACGTIFIIFTALCVKSFAEHPSDLETPLSGGDNAEALLAANMALALGMTPAEARKKFSKDKGAREAQKFAKERAEEMANLKGKLAESQKFAADAKKAGARAAADVGNTAAATYGSMNANSGNGRGTTPPPPAARQESAAYSAPSMRDDDDDVRKKRGGDDDEDELMRQYYGR
eukprot:CAMPEP_0174832924 /NCGR_PEP_ID=MMETSP1114-20130205/3927_1 /TAXON_ID=312471 /ORGANISM="Neobodo designis, Strain CCAP 1951/1" /LENGTH=309 /DNA_ID=CAMNT_0016066791 /DNA_START=144 /DNA_END=1073 /DNA_ORIENTATION=-